MGTRRHEGRRPQIDAAAPAPGIDSSGRVPRRQLGHVLIGEETFPLIDVGVYAATDINGATLIYHAGNLVTTPSGGKFLCIAATTTSAPPGTDWLTFDTTRWFLNAERVWTEMPLGLIAGQTSVDLAYRIPGSLLWLYRLGEAFDPSLGDGQTNVCLDTSRYDGTPRNLTYRENSGDGDWSPSNRPTTHSLEHPELGGGDDGCVRFNYNGFFGTGGGGCWLEASIVGLSVFGSGLLSAGGWYNPDPAAHTGPSAPLGLIFGTYNGVPSGSPFGWGVIHDFIDDSLRVFIGTHNVATVPGLARGGGMYHVGLSYDPIGDLFTLYLNAVPMTTWSGSGNLGASGDVLRIGGGVVLVSTGDRADFLLGAVDDVAGFGSTLSRDEWAAVVEGKGAGTTTTYQKVTVTAGDPNTDPGAISSLDSGGTPIPAGEFIEADGVGGSRFSKPQLKVYLNGA